MEPGPDGAVRSEVLGLEVCEVEGRLRLRDYRKGTHLRSHTAAERAIRNIESNWKAPVAGWRQALNQCYILLPERLQGVT